MPIAVENLSHTYQAGTQLETAALRRVSFTVEDGEFLGVMGHTGCGKSTLIQLLAGLLTPTAGRVLVDGADINGSRYDRGALRAKVGLVFQYPECQLFETTVAKDVAFGLKHRGLSAAERDERVRWALEVTGFDYAQICGQSPLGLSGGEKRRVAIAGILAARPKFLILDEPIAGLDPLGREAFLRLLTELNRQGTTILMVSHNTDCLAACARRLLVFDHGVLVEDGTPAQVFRDIEGMRARHLGVSQSRELAELLRRGGLEVSPEITQYDELLRAVRCALKGGGVS